MDWACKVCALHYVVVDTVPGVSTLLVQNMECCHVRSHDLGDHESLGQGHNVACLVVLESCDIC